MRGLKCQSMRKYGKGNKKELGNKKIIACIFLCICMTAVWGCGGRDSSADGTKEEKRVQEADTDIDSVEEKKEDTVDAVEEALDEEISEKILSQEMLQAVSTAKTRHRYADILSGLYWAGELPDMQVEKADDFYETVQNNSFAVTDIDNDGREELLIVYSTASMAGMFEVIYDYEPASDQLKQQLCVWPAVSFYDNGMVKAEASHNHSYGELWPYAFYQYQKDSDTYEMIAYVDAWNKEIADSYMEQPFPDDLDVDGDGTIYRIYMGNSPTFEYVDYKYNQNDYDAFYQSMMQSDYDAGATADEIQIDYKPLIYDSFKEYTPAYLKRMHEAGERNGDDKQTDIGFLFLEEGDTLREIEQYLTDNYGVVIESQDEEYDDFTIGLYQDKQVFDFVHLDGGDFTYQGEKVEDITVFGVYPGMGVDEAWERLTAYGFYANPDGEVENSLITGVGMGNRSIYFEAEDNKIDCITIRPYCRYTG